MPKLSVVILNFNSGSYLKKCLISLKKSTLPTMDYEIVVVDNASTDLSSINLPKMTNLRVFHLDKNIGFSKGNNFGVKKTSKESSYIFFLNPDTLVEEDTLKYILSTFSNNPNIDAISPYVTLVATGKLQPECHRHFPNPINSLKHFLPFLKSDYLPDQNQKMTKPHPIEAGVGAALILKKQAGEAISWWDEDYFMYGEDLQMCWDLKEKGFNLWFVPDVKISHFQGISSGIKQHTQSKNNQASRKLSIQASTQAMKIFYQKNLAKKYPFILNHIVFLAIWLLNKYRLFKKST